MFTSFVKSFGLLTEYDPIAKRLDIKTRNEFFAGYKILDWTNKIDYSQPVQIKPLVFDYRYGSMEHTPSKSYRNEAYNKTNGQNYGEQLIDTEFEFNNEEHSLLGTSVFTSMIMSSEYGRMFNGRTNEAGRDDKVLPLIAAKDGAEWKSIDESLQLAFDNGMVSCKPYRITDDTPKMVGENSYMWYSTGDNPTGSIVMSSYRQLSRIKAGYSLDFSKPKEIYYNGPEYPDNAGIYARMWQRYMQERLSVNTRVMTANVYLTPAEFFGWKFNQFVVIGDVLWHVNKIENFDPLTTQTTRVELVRVVDLAAYGSQDLTPPEAGTDKYPITIRVNTFEADGEIPLGGTLVSVSIGSEIAEDKTMWTNSSGEASFTYSLSEAEYRRIQQITAKGSLYLYNDSLSTLDSLPTFESAVSNGINLSVHMAKANLLFTMDPVVVAFTATGGTKDITVVCPVENWEIYMPTSISGVTVTKINSTTIRVVAAASSLDAEIRGEIYARYYSDALGEWQYRSTSFVQSEGTVQGSIRFYGTVQDSVTGMNLTNSNNFAVQVSAWNGSSRQVIANSALVNGSWSVSTTSTQGTWPSYVQLSVAIIVDGYTSSVKYMTPPAWASAVADGVNFGNMLMDQES